MNAATRAHEGGGRARIALRETGRRRKGGGYPRPSGPARACCKSGLSDTRFRPGSPTPLCPVAGRAGIRRFLSATAIYFRVRTGSLSSDSDVRFLASICPGFCDGGGSGGPVAGRVRACPAQPCRRIRIRSPPRGGSASIYVSR